MEEFEQRIGHSDELNATGMETLKREYEQFKKKVQKKDGNLSDDVTVKASNRQSEDIESSINNTSPTQPPPAHNQAQRVNPPAQTQWKEKYICQRWKANLRLH